MRPGTKPGHDKKNLVVDDEDSVRTVACRILEGAGFACVSATHGGEALAVIESGATPVGLVLTDMVMPVMTGAELYARLRAERPELPVLCMSAYSAGDLRGRGDGFPECPLIRKPFRPDELVERVTEALGR